MFSQLKEKAKISTEIINSIQKFFTDDNLKLPNKLKKTETESSLF